jgi:hypothetical protein
MAEGIFRTIKAGRRKLSRKESGKTPTRPGELLDHISGNCRADRRMSLKTRRFLPIVPEAPALNRNLTVRADRPPGGGGPGDMPEPPPYLPGERN